jgi:hypothetical protein
MEPIPTLRDAFRQHVLDTAVRRVARQWFEDDWYGAISRVSKRGIWGLRKSQGFVNMIRAEFKATMR